jgi:hypothetical protein
LPKPVAAKSLFVTFGAKSGDSGAIFEAKGQNSTQFAQF